jgi:UDP-glucose:(heptosyl)LPS alpha-1,3-glucosyltransferase
MKLSLAYQHVDPSRGGAETYVADLARRLVSRGHEVELLAESWDADALPGEVQCRAVPTSGSSRSARIWSFAQNVETVQSRRDFDVSIGFINTWGQDILIPQGGVKPASIEANSQRFPSGWRRALYRLGKRMNPQSLGLYRKIESNQYDLTRPTRFVAVSEMVREHLQHYKQVPSDRISVIYNAIDTGRLSADDPRSIREEFRARHGFGPSDVVALFVGHNFRLKGLPALLRALRLRMDRNPSARPVHAAVCGGGKLAPMRRLVEQAGLSGPVHLIGFEPDIRSGYLGSDFFVLPTYYDPCSLVVFEALASGLPVITTRQNGAGEVIHNGREGFIIDHPDASESLSSAIDHLCDDEARRTMSIHARSLGLEQSFDRHVDRLLSLCRQKEKGVRRAERADRFSLSSPLSPLAAEGGATEAQDASHRSRGR